MENTEKTKAETTKIDGISAQINLSPGSETHRRFAQLMREAGATTARSFIETLMDTYENPTHNADDQATIANLKSENDELNNTCHNQEVEISELKNENDDLKEKLEKANKMANENAVNGLGKQSQIEELQKQLAGKIRLDPVSAYYINELAKDNGMTSDEIVSRVILGDLQNPCANWWPKRANGRQFYVDPDEVRQKLSELKNQQNA